MSQGTSERVESYFKHIDDPNFDSSDLSQTFASKWWRVTNLYKIPDVYGNTIVYTPNRIQQDIIKRHTGRSIVLKIRQPGVSTHFCLEHLDLVLWQSNIWVCVIAHKRETLGILFNKIQFAWDHLDFRLKQMIGEPKTDNKNELFWRDRNSKIYVALEVQGGTNQVVHFSEYAQIDDERISTTLPTVPPGGVIIKESTPRGFGNKFHKDWLAAKAGKSDETPLFYPWWWVERYRLPVKDVKDENLSPEEKILIETYSLDFEQIQWRRREWQNQEQPDGSNLFPQEYPEDDLSGFLGAGESAFNTQKLESNRHWLTKNPRVYLQGVLYDHNARVLFSEERNAPLKIYEVPERELSYCIGVDVSEGGEKGDYQACQVLRRDNRQQVAVYRNKTEMGFFARDVMLLGRYYNLAHVCPERNSPGLALINDLTDHYPFHLIYQEEDKSKIQQHGSTRFGFQSNRSSKQKLVIAIQDLVREDYLFFDMQTLEEMLSYQKYDYVRNAGTGYSAAKKKHDDLIIAFGLALMMEEQLPIFVPKIKKLFDAWDVRKARRSVRAYREDAWMSF